MVRLFHLFRRLAESPFALPAISDLAAQFHVHPRTIYRDLSALEDYGIRLSDAGNGHKIMANEMRRQILHPLLTPQQALALLWATVCAQDLGLFSSELSAASKVLSVIAGTDNDLSPDALGGRLVLHKVTPHAPITGHIFLELVRLMKANGQCHILYRCDDGSSNALRQFTPHTLTLISGRFYWIGATPTGLQSHTVAADGILRIDPANR